MATCYRHPDRETGVACSSCDRPICTDCMTPTPVGMRCPECAKQTTKVRTAAAVRAKSTAAPVTRALIAVNALAYLAEIATGAGGFGGTTGSSVVREAALIGNIGNLGVADGEYWRLVTGGFLHSTIIHIGFNMYLLWILGNMLEPAIGSVRFTVLYFTALLAGSFGALLLDPQTVTVGASGAVFGLMGAAFFELRSRGIDPFQAGIGWLIVLNLGLSFVLNNISVGGHIGGLVGGSVAALAVHAADRQRQPALGFAACAAIAVAAVVLSVAVAGRTA